MVISIMVTNEVGKRRASAPVGTANLNMESGKSHCQVG